MEYVKLEDVCTGYTKNIALKDLTDNEGSYPIFGASGYIKDVDFYTEENDYIGIVKDGAGVGRVNKYPAFSSILGTMQYIVPNENTDIDYLKYAFSSLKLGENISGATIPHIYWKIYKTREIPLPPKDQQQKIATHLDKITEAINNKKKQLTLFDELVKSKFVEMFGDPVTNEMGWECKKLGEIGTFKNGLNFSQDDSGFPLKYLGVADFKNNFSLSDSDLDFVKINFEPSEDYFLENEDIVFVRSNGNKELVGRCVVTYPNKTKTIFSGFCIRFRKNKTNDLNIVYLASALKTDSLKAKTVGRGANVQNLNQKILNDLQIPLPTVTLQNQFAEFVQKCDRAKSAVKQEITCLQELLDSKMQEYFS